MTLHLTPEMLECTYELLRATPPFNRWKLPEADSLEFNILITKERSAHFRESTDGQHEIAVSASRVKSLDLLLEVVAHEMVHMRQAQKRFRDIHGISFEKLGKQVCRHHDFDWETFKE